MLHSTYLGRFGLLLRAALEPNLIWLTVVLRALRIAFPTSTPQHAPVCDSARLSTTYWLILDFIVMPETPFSSPESGNSVRAKNNSLVPSYLIQPSRPEPDEPKDQLRHGPREHEGRGFSERITSFRPGMARLWVPYPELRPRLCGRGMEGVTSAATPQACALKQKLSAPLQQTDS